MLMALRHKQSHRRSSRSLLRMYARHIVPSSGGAMDNRFYTRIEPSRFQVQQLLRYPRPLSNGMLGYGRPTVDSSRIRMPAFVSSKHSSGSIDLSLRDSVVGT